MRMAQTPNKSFNPENARITLHDPNSILFVSRCCSFVKLSLLFMHVRRAQRYDAISKSREQNEIVRQP